MNFSEPISYMPSMSGFNNQVGYPQFFCNTTPQIVNKIQSCKDRISNYEDDLCDAENFGVSKTGKYIWKIPGAAHQTALDAYMGNGNMYDGRNRRDTYNFDLGYIGGVQDAITWLFNGVLSGAISIPTSPMLPSEPFWNYQG